jgi:hypothetical protein
LARHGLRQPGRAPSYRADGHNIARSRSHHAFLGLACHEILPMKLQDSPDNVSPEESST